MQQRQNRIVYRNVVAKAPLTPHFVVQLVGGIVIVLVGLLSAYLWRGRLRAAQGARAPR